MVGAELSNEREMSWSLYAKIAYSSDLMIFLKFENF
jgi:hypothetical protein